MPYLIAVVVVLVGALAFFALRSPVEAPSPNDTESVSVNSETIEVEPAPEPEVTATAPQEETSTPTAVEEVIPEPVPEVIQAPAAPATTVSAEASYFTPRRTNHDIGVTLTLEGAIITAANVTYDGGAAVTPSHGAFDATYGAAVIGQNINTVSLSRVGGASLTSDAFNDAVADIRANL